MSNFVCPNGGLSACLPCDDDPIANISAEDADSNPFVFNFDIVERPPLGFGYDQLGCKRWCYSEESLEDAQLCAIQQTFECVVDTWTEPQTGDPPFGPPGPPGTFLNAEQTCESTCADGATFGATIAHGRVTALSLAEANRIARSLACNLARTQRICILTTSPLTAGCVNTAYSKTLVGRGGTPWVVTFDDLLFVPFCASLGDRFPYTWTIISGSLPDGLTLGECSGNISGTPTTAGSYIFTVRATDFTGAFQTKQFTMTVAQITTAATLPAATAGTFYTQNLTVTPAHDQETEVWVLDFGSLPAGLTLSAAGVISGTPTGSGLSAFTVIATFEVDGDIAICEKDFTLNVEACALPGSPVWSCPLNVTPKTYSPNDPTAPEFVSSINRLYVDGAAGVIDVVDYTQAVPALESTIALGGGAGSNRIYMIHEPVSDIVVGVYWSNIVTSQPTVFFIDPVLGIILNEITLSGFSAGFHVNPMFIRQTRDDHLVVLFMQSFLATQASQLLLIDPASQTILLTRSIPFPIGGDSYVLSRFAFNCAMNEIVLAYDATGTSIETLQRIDLETLADVALIPLPVAVTLVSGVDYDDATGHLICVEFEAGQFHIRIRDEVTGAQLQTIATGETSQIGGPRYNFALASFVAPCRALNVVKYYDTNALAQTCSVSFAGLLDPIYAAVAENGNVYIGDSGGGDNVWQLLQT